jgi:hypothetical protein
MSGVGGTAPGETRRPAVGPGAVGGIVRSPIPKPALAPEQLMIVAAPNNDLRAAENWD